MEEVFPGVFKNNGKLYTKDLKTKDLRYWNPYKSKLAAAILIGLKTWPFSRKSRVLYLGTGEGTTPSHVSDMLENGFLVGVDVSFMAMHEFLKKAGERENLIPLLANASFPEKYPEDIKKIKFDVIYQDIAQKDQVSIFLKNKKFLRKKGYALLVLKARSISPKQDVKKLTKAALKPLRKEFNVLEVIFLSPYSKDHSFVVMRNE